MRIAILTGSALRHKAFAQRFKMSKNISIEKIFYEKGDALLNDVHQTENNQLLIDHLNGREQAEKDYFNWFLNFSKGRDIKEEYVERLKNSREALRLASPDYLIDTLDELPKIINHINQESYN